MIYISTDYVFDGKNPPYKESAVPSPLNAYGKSKFEGEKVTLAEGKGELVQRWESSGFHQNSGLLMPPPPPPPPPTHPNCFFEFMNVNGCMVKEVLRTLHFCTFELNSILTLWVPIVCGIVEKLYRCLPISMSQWAYLLFVPLLGLWGYHVL